MGMQVPYRICTEIQKERNIWNIKKRNRNDIKRIVQKKTVQRYVENQLKEDMMTDQLTIKEYKDPFKGM